MDIMAYKNLYPADTDVITKPVRRCIKSHCTKKLSFPLRISPVNVTKSTVSSGFDHIC